MNKKIVLFCGGRGSIEIAKEIVKFNNIDLKLIINAYDDGLSTGILRNAQKGMLGPSDFRKNSSNLINLYSISQYHLRDLIEYRLRDNEDKLFIKNIKNRKKINCPLFEKINYLDQNKIKDIYNYLSIAVESLSTDNSDTLTLLDDFSVGNLIFLGLFISNDKRFNQTLIKFNILVDTYADIINVSNDDNYFLIGLTSDGYILKDEFEIVNNKKKLDIKNLFFIKDKLSEKVIKEKNLNNYTSNYNFLDKLTNIPSIGAIAEDNILNCDIIIYGPGTQNSSLLPSYKIAFDTIKKSKAKLKIFISNLENDNDMPFVSVTEIINKVLINLNDRKNIYSITHALINKPQVNSHLKIEGIENLNNMYQSIDNYSKDTNYQIHDGQKIITKILNIYENYELKKFEDALIIFISQTSSSLIIRDYIEGLSNKRWDDICSKICIVIELEFKSIIKNIKLPNNISVLFFDKRNNYFLKMIVNKYLSKRKYKYLTHLTGDNNFDTNEIFDAMKVLKKDEKKFLIGSRFNDKNYFYKVIKKAYGTNIPLLYLSFIGNILIILILYLRYKIIISDPLCGLRIYKCNLFNDIEINFNNNSIKDLRVFLKNNDPIQYPLKNYTLIKSKKRFQKIFNGFKNLIGTLF